MEVGVGGFIERNKAHQRISLLERVPANLLAGGFGVACKDSGNDGLVIGLVSLQPTRRNHLKATVGENPQCEPLGGVDQRRVVTAANESLVEGKAEIGVFVGVAVTAEVLGSGLVNVLEFALFSFGHARSAQENGGAFKLSQRFKQF